MSGNGPPDERDPGRTAASDGDLSARLKRLEARLDQGRRKPDPGASSHSGRPDGSQLGRAFRMSAEFMAGTIAGGLLGWSFDHYLGSRPWGLIVFLMLGFGAGIYNVMRVSGFAPGPRNKG